MLAGIRSCFLLYFSLALVLAACIPVVAQVNGVPPSVTSLGFGGSHNPAPGVAPSVTSLGPYGYGNFHPDFLNCCVNLFMPADPNPLAVLRVPPAPQGWRQGKRQQTKTIPVLPPSDSNRSTFRTPSPTPRNLTMTPQRPTIHKYLDRVTPIYPLIAPCIAMPIRQRKRPPNRLRLNQMCL